MCTGTFGHSSRNRAKKARWSIRPRPSPSTPRGRHRRPSTRPSRAGSWSRCISRGSRACRADPRASRAHCPSRGSRPRSPFPPPPRAQRARSSACPRRGFDGDLHAGIEGLRAPGAADLVGRSMCRSIPPSVSRSSHVPSTARSRGSHARATRIPSARCSSAVPHLALKAFDVGQMLHVPTWISGRVRPRTRAGSSATRHRMTRTRRGR